MLTMTNGVSGTRVAVAQRHGLFSAVRWWAAVVAALGWTGLVDSAQATDGVKADNADNLNLSSSWSSGTMPNASGWGIWDTTQTGARTANLGDDATWGGIKKTTGAYKGTIGATSGKTLTLMGVGGIGIDLSSAAADFAVAAQLKLGGSQSFTVASSRTLTIDGAVGDGGSGYALTKAGSGTLTLNGANTYGGGTTLSAGTLGIGNSGALGSGALGWTASSTLQIANTSALSVTNAITLGNVAQTFTVVKNAASASTGTETAFNGAISGGNAGATLFLNTSTTGDNTTTHRFNGANTFRAKVQLNRGAIVVGNPLGLGDTANVIYLDGNGNTSLGDLRFAVSMTLTNTVTLSNNPSPINTDVNSVSLAGVVSGAGTSQPLTKLGSGTLTLLAANTYSGGTVLNAGSLTITNGNALGSGALSVNLVNSSTFLTVANNGAVTFPNAVVLPSPSSAQMYRLAKQSVDQTNGTELALNGNITGGNANTTLQLDSTTAGDISTTYRLSGTNTFRATVNLNRGSIVVANAKGLGDVANLIYLNGNGNTVLGDLRFAVSMTLTNPVQLVNAQSPINTDVNDVALAGAVSGGNMTKLGSGTLTLRGANTYSGATAVSNGVFRLAGAGTLGNGTYAGAILNLGTIDFAGSATQTLSGAISGTGALAKTGSGTLTLSNVNTYGGATTVGGGKLVGAAGGSCSNSAVTVQSGGTLGVAAADNTKQWTCASLSFDAGTTALEFAFGAGLPSATVAPLSVAGGVAFTGTPAVTVNGSLPVGTYPLMTWTGSLSGTAPAAVTLPPHVSGNLSVSGSTLFLNVTATTQPLRWALTGNGVWDVNAAQNWKDSAGTATAYQESEGLGDSVLLDETYITSPPTITLNAAVSPLSLTVNNSAYDYTVSGGGSIAGSAGLSKQGGGTLTLGTANTYAGATVIGGGTLSVAALADGGQPSGIGASPAAAANLVIGGGALRYTGASAGSDRSLTLGSGGGTVDVYTAGSTLTFSGAVSGGYAFTKAGAGNVAFSAANALSAASGVIVAAGDLQVGAWAVGGAKTNSIAVGATFTSTGSVQVPAYPGAPGPYTTFAVGGGTWRLRATGASVGSPDLFAPSNDINEWGIQILTPLDTGAAGATRYICGYNQHCNPVNWANANDYGDLILDGSITGAGDLWFQGYPHATEAMAFALDADNSGFSGGVTVGGGELILGHSNALTAANAVRLSPGAGSNAALRVWNKSVTIGALSSGGAGAVEVSGSGPLAALTVFQNTNTTFAGTLTQRDAKRVYTSGSALSFAKDGTGTLTLAWTNGYTGTTTVRAGTLALGANGALVSTNVAVAAGAAFDVTAKPAYAFTASQALTFGVDPAVSNAVGRLAASGLDITDARVSFSVAGALTAKTYTVATYTSLTGAAFASVTGKPAGYYLDYNYKGAKQIVLVKCSGTMIQIF